uniref:RNA-directed DNA polymerase, eukaryota n=1 Tax=Tanacetum cinerariifolium TaxID=118510 RepID=A0A6L2J566_TANCI|nr:RNA-directed DNA polymerase, eukaryota [Tanacetum cinerariifolium]
MSIYKAPLSVLHEMEMLRNKFFNGGDAQGNKITWVAWDKVLSSKNNGGLGVSSFYTLNRALLLKWVWRFLSHDCSMWSQILRVIHGSRLDFHSHKCISPWGSILREIQVLDTKWFDFLFHCKVRIGDWLNTIFWLDVWILDMPLCARFPRIFALENDTDVSVAVKQGAPSLDASFRRPVRDGVERLQWEELVVMVGDISLSSSADRWVCDLNGDGEFCVKDIRTTLDNLFLPSSVVASRWVKHVPIKVNIFAWRARLDRLLTRGNLISRVVLNSSNCSNCDLVTEDSQHLFLSCDLAKSIAQKLCRWWWIQWVDVLNFDDWNSWFSSIRLPVKLKVLLEGVFFTSWWHIWSFRNRLLFDASPPRRSVLFDDIVSSSFIWSVNRCNSFFSWESWLKNPNLISL